MVLDSRSLSNTSVQFQKDRSVISIRLLPVHLLSTIRYTVLAENQRLDKLLEKYEDIRANSG